MDNSNGNSVMSMHFPPRAAKGGSNTFDEDAARSLSISLMGNFNGKQVLFASSRFTPLGEVPTYSFDKNRTKPDAGAEPHVEFECGCVVCLRSLALWKFGCLYMLIRRLTAVSDTRGQSQRSDADTSIAKLCATAPSCSDTRHRPIRYHGGEGSSQDRDREGEFPMGNSDDKLVVFTL